MEDRFTLDLDREELRITRSALRSYLQTFGHDERPVHDVVRAVLAKLPAEDPADLRRSAA
jgi:hypothetical protein